MGTSTQLYNPYRNSVRADHHMPPPLQRNRWWRGFLIASLIHWVIILLLLWSWTNYQESKTLTQVKMCLVLDKDPVIHELRLPLDCAPPPAPAPVPQAKPKPAQPQPQVEIPTPVVKQTASRPTPKPPQRVPEAASRFLQSYLDNLRARIRATRTYPPQSIENREEGDVMAGFTLFKDGTIRNIRVARSSGYLLLDENAVQSLRQVSPFDPIPNEIIKAFGKDSFNFEIPIEYRLSEIL